jgi:hypothetical protein
MPLTCVFSDRVIPDTQGVGGLSTVSRMSKGSLFEAVQV